MATPDAKFERNAHENANEVINDRLIDLPASTVRLALWEEVAPSGEVTPFYAISLDGRTMATVRRTSYELKLRYASFDPAIVTPSVEPGLAGGETAGLFIVQFVTQPLEQFRPVRPDASGERHEVLAGLEETDIIPFGGRIERVECKGPGAALMTHVPPFPIYPPEFAWMRTPQTDTAALVLTDSDGCGRVAYLAADVDRCFAREQLPDHGHLLANLVRWAARGDIPLEVDGPGYIDCHLYRQGRRLILHMINLTHCRAWPNPGEEPVPVGPFEVRLRLAKDFAVAGVISRVSQSPIRHEQNDTQLLLHVHSILDHEMIVIE